jgi:hypothetical protein
MHISHDLFLSLRRDDIEHLVPILVEGIVFRFDIITGQIYMSSSTNKYRKVESMGEPVKEYACLDDYHKGTMEMLLKLKVVEYVDAPDGASCTCQTTKQLQEYMDKIMDEKQVKYLYYDDIIVNLASEQNIKLKKKLLKDMMSLLSFIVNYGPNCEIMIHRDPGIG